MFNLTEKQLEDYLWNNPHVIDSNITWTARQLSLPSGRLDLLGERVVNNRLYIVVVELKRDRFSSSALAQVSKYAYDIEMILEVACVNATAATIHSRHFPVVEKMVVATSPPAKSVIDEACALNVELRRIEVTTVQESGEEDSTGVDVAGLSKLPLWNNAINYSFYHHEQDTQEDNTNG